MVQIYYELNNPGSGSLSVQKYDPAAALLTVGKLVKVMYRGQPRGGFFVENIVRDAVKSGEKGAEWVKITGRGALAVLDDGLVYPAAGTNDSARSFSNQPMASMLLALINEAKARGCFPKLRCEFSATKDSNGDTWSDSSSLSFSVDSSLLDVLNSLVELGIEFDFKNDFIIGDYVLYAYQTAIGSDRSADVVFRAGSNCEDVAETIETGELKNALHIGFQGGFTEISDASSAAAYRRREGSFQAGNSLTAGAAQSLATPSLTLQKYPKTTITIKVNDGTGPRIFVDYNLGDWVGYDAGSGVLPTKYRIRGIALDIGENKFATATLDLNSVRMERELRNTILLKKLGKGVLSAASSPMPAGLAAAIATHNADNLAHASKPLSGDLAGTLGTPIVAKIRGVLVDALTAIADTQVIKYNASAQKLVAGYIQWLEIENKPSTFAPSAHASNHRNGGNDSLKLDDLTEPDDNTDLNASTNKHGLLPKLGGGTTNFLRADGTWAAPAGGGSGDVVGPASAVDGHLAVFDGTTGKLIKDGGAVPSGSSGGTDVLQNQVFS